jgi:RecJ-like exonuclease
MSEEEANYQAVAARFIDSGVTESIQRLFDVAMWADARKAMDAKQQIETQLRDFLKSMEELINIRKGKTN